MKRSLRTNLAELEQALLTWNVHFKLHFQASYSSFRTFFLGLEFVATGRHVETA